MLFGRSRSGSTLLKDLLDSHPEIHCDGEPLFIHAQASRLTKHIDGIQPFLRKHTNACRAIF